MTYVDKIQESYNRQTAELRARQLAQITRGQVDALLVQARRASEIAARHPEEAPLLLDRVTDAIHQIAVFGDADAAISMLTKRLDGAEWAVRSWGPR